MKLIIHSQNSAVQPLKFANRYVISSHTLWWMQLFIRKEILLTTCALSLLRNARKGNYNIDVCLKQFMA